MHLTARLREQAEKLLSVADVRINGGRSWDLAVHNDDFYHAVFSKGALGLGESYVDGWWDAPDLAEFFDRVLKFRLDRRVAFNWSLILEYVLSSVMNRQKQSRASGNVHRHYDLGNDLYRNMLGRWMLYSSANWKRAASLDEAGEAKLEFVCRNLQLQPGQTILDIGCGWGGFAKYAAQNYGVRVVGITISDQQANFARSVCSDLPVEIRLQDYRNLDGSFDHIVSLGMFEHVGYKNYRKYMEIVRRCLKPGGFFFLNTIGGSESRHCANAWTDKYIFPAGMPPSMAQIGAAVDGIFGMKQLADWADFYDRTLMAWFENFQRNWNRISARYGDRFFRMWKYYLLSSAGAFRARTIQDWQILFSC